MQLYIEYSQMTNQTLHSFSSAVQTNFLVMNVSGPPIFKQNVQNVYQLQQHTIQSVAE